MAETRYDAIVIGAGQAGVPLSQALAGAGIRTALVEREHVGGTCINEGCTPTKTMVASGRVAYLARRGADYGVRTGPLTIELAKVRERKRAIVDSFRNGSQGRIEKTKNLELIFGAAQFTGAQTLRVRKADGGEATLGADKIFINAGCRPAVPKLEGLSGVSFLNSTRIMELDQVPEHLIVLGGGYIGLEFGQMFRRFGARVTIVQAGAQLLGQEDADVAEEVLKILQEDGIEVLLNSRAKSVGGSGGQLKLTAESAGKSREIGGSQLLVAAGRVPNTDSLQLDAAGIAVDARGFIRTNDKLETNVAGVYGLGDIKGGPAFTHISYDDFRIIRTNVIERGSATIADRLVPYTVFIDPQLGRVGMSETEARKTGREIRVAKMPMNYVARALEMDESRGFMKAIVDRKSGQILGAAVLGIEGGEIMSQLQIAMMGKLPYTALKDGVFAHPTLAESLNNLFAHFAS
ncbi:MAG TPA: mercuric reductase [Candidatus Eisenbacteria bacterium]|jgi:pyruvate/2-oxoglutarate dehydrogenase complex dihydrolipoamide dehydrogenase (E3) component|nr:mercuric reductase [Candidatus Eisenbacteria bacterium]